MPASRIQVHVFYTSAANKKDTGTPIGRCSKGDRFHLHSVEAIHLAHGRDVEPASGTAQFNNVRDDGDDDSDDDGRQDGGHHHRQKWNKIHYRDKQASTTNIKSGDNKARVAISGAARTRPARPSNHRPPPAPPSAPPGRQRQRVSSSSHQLHM